MRQIFRTFAVAGSLVFAALWFSSARIMAGMGSANGVVTVMADENTSCTAYNGTLNFGTYLGTNKTAIGSFSVACSEGIIATIGMDGGTNGANLGSVQNKARPVTRAMNDATGDYLGYDLFYSPGDQSNDTNPWNTTTHVLYVYFGNVSGVTGSGLKITNGVITGTGGTPAPTGTPGISFTVGVGGTTSTGGSPSVSSGGNSGGVQTAVVNVYGLMPAISPLPPSPITGNYSDFVGIIATF